jgi:hypothetical protein
MEGENAVYPIAERGFGLEKKKKAEGGFITCHLTCGHSISISQT